jgi:hypothetical protein
MTPPTVEPQLTASTSDVPPKAKREFWLVFAALTFLYVIAVAMGNRRYVWFDELFTFDIARSASLHELWDRELRFDMQTPTGYLLSRLSMWIFGTTPFGLRFPSMLEFYVGSVAVLLYVRRKAGIAFATLAVLMLWAAAPTLYYAIEARPYALLFLSFACLLLSWDIAIRAQPRRLALLGISISTLAMAVAHVFAPFTLFAFIVAEAVRFRRRRKLDYPLWAALLLPMLAMLIYVPLIRAFGGVVFGTHASVHTMFLFFQDTLGAPIMSFVLLATLLAPAAKRSRTTNPGFLREEIALLACMFLSPVLLNLVLMHRHGTFYDRYCVTSQVAIMVALAILLPYRVRMNHLAAYAGSILLVFFIFKTQIWHVARYPVPRNAAFLESIQPNLPLVVAEGQVFMEMNQYENAALLSRLYFLKDQQASMQYLHTNLFQDYGAPDLMKKAGFPFKANIASYSSFVSQHRQFLLLGSPIQWVFYKLRQGGASIAFVGDYDGALPYMDTSLYLVTMPSQ